MFSCRISMELDTNYLLKNNFYSETLRSRYEEYGKREPNLVSQYVMLTDAGGIGLVLSFIIFQK